MTNVHPRELEQARGARTTRMSVDTGRVAVDERGRQVDTGLRVVGTPRRGLGESQSFALTFPVPPEHRPTLGIRLELTLPHPEQVEEIVVDFTSGGEAVARWAWQPREHQPKRARPTFVLREGSKGAYFTPSPVDGDIRTADRVEISATVVPGQPVDLSLLRWGWIS